ncbi:hypothetical protein [Methylobacterium sp. AMS5]|uniref:hypothetical protein n=1 Tax=Methylobacterium sp. AMS5 TaxID=925818 RepID=UPI00074FA5A5|nr:hypothetical protein [Methylobacterium sp. AMS5]AMB45907.1 hypothetical protein Y590_13380 [Methylobacterium sp. AMS5]
MLGHVSCVPSGSLTGFRQSLQEEEAMARRVRERIGPTTKHCLDLTAAGEKADR